MTKRRYERPTIQKLNAGLMNKFGTRTDYEPVTHIEGVAVSDLLARHGSPLFVLSERTIRRLYREAYTAFTTRYPRVQFAWSYKTNYLNAVCRIFHQEGAWAEVVSGFEYAKALGNGVPGDRILFNGPEKSMADLEAAIRNDSLIHIDHFDEIRQLTEACERTGGRPRVAIRVNMDTGIHPRWDRFGFNFENGEAREALERILATGRMRVTGLHCHIGTFMLTTEPYRTAVRKLRELAAWLHRNHDVEVAYIDMGGGFPSRNTLRGSFLPGADSVPGVDDFAEAICSEMLEPMSHGPATPLLVLETGRALIDEAGWLLGTVVAEKRLSDGRRANIMDFGVNLLFTANWYEHRITPAQPFTHHTESAVLYGPLCMNIDVVRHQAELPLLQRGDHVVVHNVGAYNMTQWMQFIHMRPRVVLIDEASGVHLIREAEDLTYLEQLERLPGHLPPGPGDATRTR